MAGRPSRPAVLTSRPVRPVSPPFGGGARLLLRLGELACFSSRERLVQPRGHRFRRPPAALHERDGARRAARETSKALLCETGGLPSHPHVVRGAVTLSAHDANGDSW